MSQSSVQDQPVELDNGITSRTSSQEVGHFPAIYSSQEEIGMQSFKLLGSQENTPFWQRKTTDELSAWKLGSHQSLIQSKGPSEKLDSLLLPPSSTSPLPTIPIIEAPVISLDHPIDVIQGCSTDQKNVLKSISTNIKSLIFDSARPVKRSSILSYFERSNSPPSPTSTSNIRRRVYDALNVLTASSIINRQLCQSQESTPASQKDYQYKKAVPLRASLISRKSSLLESFSALKTRIGAKQAVLNQKKEELSRLRGLLARNKSRSEVKISNLSPTATSLNVIELRINLPLRVLAGKHYSVILSKDRREAVLLGKREIEIGGNDEILKRLKGIDDIE